MPIHQDARSDRLARHATAAGVALAGLALLLPTPRTSDHALLAEPAQAAAFWSAGDAAGPAAVAAQAPRQVASPRSGA